MPICPITSLTAITDAPFADRTSYTPGGIGDDSTTVAASEKRSVIESVRAGVPRRRLDVRVVPAREHHLVAGFFRLLHERGANALAAAGNEEFSLLHG